MKTATLLVETVLVLCPCGGTVTDPANGSEFWTREELDGVNRAACRDCGETVRLPKSKSVRMQ